MARDRPIGRAPVAGEARTRIPVARVGRFRARSAVHARAPFRAGLPPAGRDAGVPRGRSAAGLGGIRDRGRGRVPCGGGGERSGGGPRLRRLPWPGTSRPVRHRWAGDEGLRRAGEPGVPQVREEAHRLDRRGRQCGAGLARRGRPAARGRRAEGARGPSRLKCAVESGVCLGYNRALRPGEVAEWSIASDSKSEVPSGVPWVRIPPSPPVKR